MENAATASKKMFWVGWTLSILSSLALIMSGAIKLIQPASMAEETAMGLEHIGWKMNQMTGLGILEIACVIIYLIPQTSILGAILVTGYMGGAIATHVRVGDAFIAQALIGVVVWLGLWLRDPRLRELIPLRS
jgi:hypothetical protein